MNISIFKIRLFFDILSARLKYFEIASDSECRLIVFCFVHNFETNLKYMQCTTCGFGIRITSFGFAISYVVNIQTFPSIDIGNARIVLLGCILLKIYNIRVTGIVMNLESDRYRWYVNIVLLQSKDREVIPHRFHRGFCTIFLFSSQQKLWVSLLDFLNTSCKQVKYKKEDIWHIIWN